MYLYITGEHVLDLYIKGEQVLIFRLQENRYCTFRLQRTGSVPLYYSMGNRFCTLDYREQVLDLYITGEWVPNLFIQKGSGPLYLRMFAL